MFFGIGFLGPPLRPKSPSFPESDFKTLATLRQLLLGSLLRCSAWDLGSFGKSCSQALHNSILMIVDQTVINAGLDFRRYPPLVRVDLWAAPRTLRYKEPAVWPEPSIATAPLASGREHWVRSCRWYTERV